MDNSPLASRSTSAGRPRRPMDETRLNKIAADLATVGEANPNELSIDLMSDGHTMTNRLAGGVYSRTGGVRTSYSAGVQPFDLEKVTATLFQTTRVVSGGKYKSSPRLASGVQAKIKGTVKDSVGFTCSPLQSRMRRLSNENLSMDESIMSIGTLKVHLQEQAIIDDLLYIMMGIEGRYIDMTVHEGEYEDGLQSATFTVDDTLDPSLNDIVQRILPLASHYITIQSFIDSRAKFEYGLVNHALCAAIREILKEYLVLISQLERDFRNSTQQFTIQKLWYHSHLSLRTMGVLGALVNALARATTTEEYQDPRTAASENEVILPLRAKGGGVLGKLAERMLQLYGDETTRKLYSHLLERAAVPYFGMLDAWIRYGEIRDPYDEFMVQERRDLRRGDSTRPDLLDEYWERRYVLRDMAVPAFLEPLKMKILLAGKYLNVIRECGISVTNSERLEELEQGAELQDGATLAAAKGEIMRTLNGTRYLRTIEAAYNYSNRTLLRMLLTDHNLLGRLRSIKRYFLLDQCDFLTHFLDLAVHELRQPARDVSMTKLQSLLELVLRTSSTTASDPYKEDLRVEMSRRRLVDGLLRVMGRTAENIDDEELTFLSNNQHQTMVSRHGSDHDATSSQASNERKESILAIAPPGAGDERVLTGTEAFSLNYQVAFPLSLIISHRAIAKYQLLFQHLFQVKHIERLLCHVWQEHARGPAWRLRERARWNARVFALRSRMLWFVQQFTSYVCSEVIEPRWRQLEKQLKEVTLVDELMTLHLDYVDTCLKGCMLTNAELLKTYSKMMQNCEAFASYVDRYARKLTPATPNSAPIVPTQEWFEQQDVLLQRREIQFNELLGELCKRLNYSTTAETPEFTCLLVRLQFRVDEYGDGAMIQ